MKKTACFRFISTLNDFLPKAKAGLPIAYSFSGQPAVKDTIEAIGVPHVEVAAITVNDVAVDFSYALQEGNVVVVYPEYTDVSVPVNYSLRPEPPVPAQFILDVHLGSLARGLRLLGFDSRYEQELSDKKIAQLAQAEKRIVLTRDVGLLKHNAIVWGYWLRSQHTDRQLHEVVKQFRLQQHIHPFTRCLVCNGRIVPVEKETVQHQLPPNATRYFHEFYQCTSCKRVYWKGSHYERMQKQVTAWVLD